MKVKHKVTGKIHEVSEDYFSKYEDKLQVLEEVKEPKTKPKKQAKVVSDESPAITEESPEV